jgi:hypothetical protein
MRVHAATNECLGLGASAGEFAPPAEQFARRSDLEIGPDRCLYLLSDESSRVARLDDLPAVAAPLHSLMRGGSAIWMASRKVSHSPRRVVRSSGSTHTSRAEISFC